MNNLNLSYPHGYLIWKGTQKAIVSDVLLNDNDLYLITTGIDAFCMVRLKTPSVWIIQEFDRKNELHCTKVWERKLFWPDAKSLYVYSFRVIDKFEQPKLFIDGRLSEYKPTFAECEMIALANNLPAKIILNDRAVCAGQDGFDISELIGDDKKLKQILEAVYETEVLQLNGGLSLPIYQLALVRSPRLVVREGGK